MPPAPVKIVIAGGFGAGKTTAVSAISEITPLTTEAAMTSAGAAVDFTRDIPGKTSTTVALDFGCITIDRDLKLYLFGTPGQDRFWFMWDDISRGAVGAVVLLDEPTDNLDLVSAEALQQALASFQGTVLAVTHDRWFARSFDRFLVFRADGEVAESPGPVWDSARVERVR